MKAWIGVYLGCSLLLLAWSAMWGNRWRAYYHRLEWQTKRELQQEEGQLRTQHQAMLTTLQQTLAQQQQEFLEARLQALPPPSQDKEEQFALEQLYCLHMPGLLWLDNTAYLHQGGCHYESVARFLEMP